jgi:hypothetical protein
VYSKVQKAIQSTQKKENKVAQQSAIALGNPIESGLHLLTCIPCSVHPEVSEWNLARELEKKNLVDFKTKFRSLSVYTK